MTRQRLRQILLGNSTASADEAQVIQGLIEFCNDCGSRFGMADPTTAAEFESTVDSTSTPKFNSTESNMRDHDITHRRLRELIDNPFDADPQEVRELAEQLQSAIALVDQSYDIIKDHASGYSVWLDSATDFLNGFNDDV